MEKNKAEPRCSWWPALIPRTAALFIIFSQILFLAGDLADTSFFAASLSGALGCALFLYNKRLRLPESLAVIFLVPWAIRFFVALPRWFAPPAAWINFDSLLLNLDRNNFTSLLPFYWTAFSTCLCLKKRTFLKTDIFLADLFFLVLFCIAPSASMEVYRWPVLMIGLFGLVFFLQILSFILSHPGELKIRGGEKAGAAVTALVLVIFACFLFIRPSQEKAVEQGGGLLEPNLFRFDFSQVLRLDPEISMNDDLILIVKKGFEDNHILLRRYTLSEYNRGQGFSRHETLDEKAHPQKLPDRRTRLPHQDEIREFREMDQEYYLVNFDPAAFIGMNMPVEIIPYDTWDTSSFSSVYSVQSQVSEAFPMELLGSVRSEEYSAASLGLSEEEYRLYTNYGGDPDYAMLANEITRGAGSYWVSIEMIYEFLKYGEYRYSLKPGIAPDGDQLKYFLFESKKGYCSYYAFAFALMLRSIGIPCRAAAGFFIDNDTGVFNYYPVRANMAHAWVEVWFPGYGWIEYDPTSGEPAQGEEFMFGSGAGSGQFEDLLKEILDNHSLLEAREGSTDITENYFSGFRRDAVRFIKNCGPVLLACIILILFIVYRCGLLLLSRIGKNLRKKAWFLWAHSARRLRLTGFRKNHDLGEAEWAGALGIDGLYDLYRENAKARFARDFSDTDLQMMKNNYIRFNAALCRTVPLHRRLFSWICPPLALLLPDRRLSLKALLLLPLIFCLCPTDAQDIQNAEEIFIEAYRAQEAENWERAVELYTRGSELYPQNLNFPRSLGYLFYQRRLFHLAWNEYLKCEQIEPFNPDILFQLARTAAYLNMNEVSAQYLEKVLLMVPNDIEAIGSLGWIYFKIHRLDEGERLLLSAIDRMGPDNDYAMTLGTIYSDLFNYRESKNWYLRAIAGAESAGDRLFASVAHYNLSILESRFYEYDLAYEQANFSLNSVNRSSGRLARGELYLRRQELSRALAEYQDAYEMDTSPLSKLSLAEVFQIGGRLQEARLYAEDCLKNGDLSWMISYGIDPVRYKMEIHEILKKTYEGLEKAEKFNFSVNLWDRILSFSRKIFYRFKASVHGHLYRKYCLLTASSYGAGDISKIHQDAVIQYYNAFEAYTRRAFDYLYQARYFEEPLIPQSGRSYDLEEGILLNKKDLLIHALDEFDPRWEQDQRARVYTELAAKGSRNREESQKAAEELYAINPGALLQNGVTLRAGLEFDGISIETEKALKKAARSAGIAIVPDGTVSRYTLVFSGEGGINCELLDRNQRILFRNISLPSLSAVDTAAFSGALRDMVFNGFR